LLLEDAKSVEIGVVKMIVAAAEKISIIRSVRNSSNALSDGRLPAFLPHELVTLHPREFNQALLEQR
jgi:hypothetical protein